MELRRDFELYVSFVRWNFPGKFFSQSFIIWASINENYSNYIVFLSLIRWYMESTFLTGYFLTIIIFLSLIEYIMLLR